MSTITAAPALDHDAEMLRRFGTRLNANAHLERAIVWNLCAHMAAAGWTVYAVDDSEEVTRTADAKAALELIFNLDEAWLEFRKGRARSVVFLVVGNGEDIVSDWSYREGDADGFNAAITSFSAEAIAPALFFTAQADSAADIATAALRMIETRLNASARTAAELRAMRSECQQIAREALGEDGDASRLLQCVRACAGVADPAQAIEAARVLIYGDDDAHQRAIDCAHAAGISR